MNWMKLLQPDVLQSGLFFLAFLILTGTLLAFGLICRHQWDWTEMKDGWIFYKCRRCGKERKAKP